MKNIIIKSENLILRHTRPEDLNYVLQAEAEAENRLYVAQWSREQHVSAILDEDIFHVLFETADYKQPVGYAIIAGLKNINLSIEFRRFVITEKGKGLGRTGLKLVKELVFNRLNAHRLWLDVRYNNERAQKLYKSEGFTEEGVLREAILLDCEFHDLKLMAMLKKDYKEGIYEKYI